MIESVMIYAKFIIAWVLLTLAITYPFVLAYPLWRKLLHHTQVNTRIWLNLQFSLLPVLLAALILLLYSQPQLSGYFVDWHCHNNVCGPHHLYLPTDSHLGHGLSSSILLLVAFVLVFLCYQFVKARRYLRLLQHLADDDLSGNYKVFDTKQLLAWSTGFWRTQIYLSTALVARLSNKQLQFVLAHEYAHVFARDNIKKLLLNYLTRMWPSKQRELLRSQVELDMEVACDLKAAQGRFNATELEQLFSQLTPPSKLVSKEQANSQHQCLTQAATRLVMFVTMQTDSKINRGVKAQIALLVYVILITTLYAQFAHFGLEWLMQ